MKKLLGLLVLGLLLSSNAYAETIANCEVESGEISGQDVNNKLDIDSSQKKCQNFR